MKALFVCKKTLREIVPTAACGSAVVIAARGYSVGWHPWIISCHHYVVPCGVLRYRGLRFAHPRLCYITATRFYVVALQ